MVYPRFSPGNLSSLHYVVVFCSCFSGKSMCSHHPGDRRKPTRVRTEMRKAKQDKCTQSEEPCGSVLCACKTCKEFRESYTLYYRRTVSFCSTGLSLSLLRVIAVLLQRYIYIPDRFCNAHFKPIFHSFLPATVHESRNSATKEEARN